MLKKNIIRFSVRLMAPLFVLSLLSVSTSQAEDGFKVDGYGQTWYLSDSSDVAADEIKSEFYIRRARLGAKGKYTDGAFPVNIRLLGEFAGSTAILLDNYLNIKFNPLFQIQAGQFKYHFTEIGTASSKVKAIGLLYRPEIVQNIHGNLGQSGGKLRDIGLRLHGAQKGDFTFGYDLEILNGDGANKDETNDDRAIIAHIYGKTGGIKFFGAYFTGQEKADSANKDETGMSLGASYKQGPLWVQGEYAAATYETTGATDVEPSGWYLQAAYNVMPDLQLLARYGLAEVDSNTSNTEMTTTAVGANYKIGKHVTVSANYFMRDADAAYSEKTLLGKGGDVPLTGSKVGDVFLTQFEFVY